MPRPSPTIAQVTSPSSQASYPDSPSAAPSLWSRSQSLLSLGPGNAGNNSFYLPPTMPYYLQLLFLRKRKEELGSSAGRGQRTRKTLTQCSRGFKFQEFQRGAEPVLASIAKRSGLLMVWQNCKMISTEITCNIKLFYFKFVCI